MVYPTFNDLLEKARKRKRTLPGANIEVSDLLYRGEPYRIEPIPNARVGSEPELTLLDKKGSEEEFDAEGAKGLGYNLPTGWKLKRTQGRSDTLLSPRGFKYQDFKAGPDGSIQNFKRFDLNDNPLPSPPDFAAEEQAGLTALAGTQRSTPTGIQTFRAGAGPPGTLSPTTRVLPGSNFQNIPFKGEKPPVATFPVIPRPSFTPTGISEFRKGTAPTGEQEQFKMPTPEEASTPSPIAIGIAEFIKGNVKDIREKGFWRALEESVPQNAQEYIRFAAGPEEDPALLKAGRLFGAGIGELGTVGKPATAAGKGVGKAPKGKGRVFTQAEADLLNADAERPLFKVGDKVSPLEGEILDRAKAKPLPGQAPLAQAGKEVAIPTPELGESISKTTGMKFEGLQEAPGGKPPVMVFTDPETRSTLFASNLEEAQTRLTAMRAKFPKAPAPEPVPPTKVAQGEAAITPSPVKPTVEAAPQPGAEMPGIVSPQGMALREVRDKIKVNINDLRRQAKNADEAYSKYNEPAFKQASDNLTKQADALESQLKDPLAGLDIPQPGAGDIIEELRTVFIKPKNPDSIVLILPDGTPLASRAETGIGAFQHIAEGLPPQSEWLDEGVIRVVQEKSGAVSLEIRHGEAISPGQMQSLSDVLKGKQKVYLDITDSNGSVVNSLEDTPSKIKAYLQTLSPQPGAGAAPPVKPPATTTTPPPGGTPPVGTGVTVTPPPTPPKSPLGTIEGMWAKGRGRKKGVPPDFYLKAQEYGNDIYFGIRQMQARVAKGQSITPGGKDDIVTLLTRAPGAANAGATRSILAIEEIKKVAPKALADDINTILYANHAKEVLAEKGVNRVMAGGFRNASDLDDALAQLQLKLGPDEFKRTEQAAEVVKNLYASERQRLADAGLITQELADELAQKYPWYNPLHYVDDAEELAAQGKSVKPFNVISSGLKRLTEEGTAREAIAPLNQLGDQLIRNEVRIVKNDTAKAIVQMALQDKTLTGKVVKLSGIRPVASVEGQTVFRRTYQDIPGTLSFFENGTRQIYQVPDFIYREANVLTQTISNPVSSIVGSMNGVSRAAFTSASPPFVVANMLNDMLTAFISRGIMPQETGARLVQSLRGLGNDKVMQAFRLSGGYQQRFFGRSENALAKEIGVTGGKVIKGPNFFKKAWQSIPAAGEAGEQAPRTALFKRQLDKTLPDWRNMTPEQIAATPQGRKAAADAVELTINFGRGGYAIKAANPFVIFLNASMEGTKLPFRALRDNPAARWRLAGVGAGVAGLAGYNLSYPEYMDIPNYIRWGSVLVMLPSKEKNPDGTNKPNYAAIIPRTREWGAFLGPLTYGMERIYAEAPAEFGQFSATMAPMLSPIAEVPLPQVISELVQQQANWDFYRSRPIVSQSLENLPKEEQTTPFVSRTVEAGAQAVGVSPVRAQHFVSGIFGGAAGAATSVTDYIADLIKPETPSPEIAALAARYEALPVEKGIKDTITQEDFLKRMNASDKRKMLNYLNERPKGLPIVSSLGARVMPGRGGQLAENKFNLDKSVDILPTYFKDTLTPEEMKRVDTKLWNEKKATDAKILQQYDLAMINKSSAAREKYLADNPDVNATALLWGKTTTIHSIEAANKLMAEAEKYGITPELIPAFDKNEKGQERFPSDKKLWKAYFEYEALPGTSYLAMTQNQVDAGMLPDKYRKAWAQYHNAKTDFAKDQIRKANKEAAKGDWREDLRKKDNELDKWLIENKGLKPLTPIVPKAQTAPTKTARPQLRGR